MCCLVRPFSAVMGKTRWHQGQVASSLHRQTVINYWRKVTILYSLHFLYGCGRTNTDTRRARKPHSFFSLGKNHRMSLFLWKNNFPETKKEKRKESVIIIIISPVADFTSSAIAMSLVADLTSTSVRSGPHQWLRLAERWDGDLLLFYSYAHFFFTPFFRKQPQLAHSAAAALHSSDPHSSLRLPWRPDGTFIVVAYARPRVRARNNTRLAAFLRRPCVVFITLFASVFTMLRQTTCLRFEQRSLCVCVSGKGTNKNNSFDAILTAAVIATAQKPIERGRKCWIGL